MKAITPSEQVSWLLERYQHLGGVIDHILIDPGEEDRPPSVIHREAALLTLNSIGRVWDEYFERLIQTPEYRHHQRGDFFTVNVNLELLTGQVISPDEFVGPRWDRRQRRFLHHGDGTGYAHAFFDPPYGLRDHYRTTALTADETEGLFRLLTEAFFGNFSDSLTVYEWSTNCSNYFDAGREWWGTYFWTVEVPNSGQLIGVAASTTD